MKKNIKKLTFLAFALGLLLLTTTQTVSANPSVRFCVPWSEPCPPPIPSPVPGNPGNGAGNGGNHMCQIPGVQAGNWGSCLWSLEIVSE